MTFRPKTLAVIALTLVLLGVLAGVAGPALAAEPRIYEITDVSFASVNEQVKITFRVRVNELGSAFPETVTIERSDTAGAFLNPPVAVLKVGREIPAEPGLHTVTWTDAGVEVGKTYHYKLNGKTFTNAVTVRSKDDEAPPAEPGSGPGEEAGTGETPGGSVGGGILSNAIGWLFIKLWEAVDGLFGLRDIEQWVFGTGPAAADHLHVVPPIRWPAVKLAHDTLSAIAWLFLGLATPLLGLRLLYSNLDPADRYSLLDIGKGLVIFVAVLGFGMTFFKVAADLSYAVLGEMHKAFHFEGDLIRTLAGGIRNMTAASIAGGYLASGLLLVTLALATVWVNVIYILRQITLCVCLATMPVFAFFAVFPFTRGIFVHYVRYTLATLMVPLFHAVILALFLGTLHGGAEPGTQAADFARAFGGPLQALMVLFAMIPLGSLPYMLVGASAGGVASVAGMAAAAGAWRLMKSGVAGRRAVTTGAAAAYGAGRTAAVEGEPLMKRLSAAAKVGTLPLAGAYTASSWTFHTANRLTAGRLRNLVQAGGERLADARAGIAETIRTRLPAPVAQSGLADRAARAVAGTDIMYRQAITSTAQEFRQLDQAQRLHQAAYHRAHLSHQVAATELRRVEADLQAQALGQGIPENGMQQWVQAQPRYLEAQARAMEARQARDAHLLDLRKTELARADKLTVYENLLRDYANYAPERTAVYGAPTDQPRPGGGLRNRIGYRH